MKNKNTSIVIRSRNEADHLESLLKSIKAQEGIDCPEIIIVDNESTDRTDEVIKKYGAKKIIIKKSEFTYPNSMNLGVTETTGTIVILTVAHALPISKQWVQIALNHFDDDKVAGVFGPCLPNIDTNYFEKIIYSIDYFVKKIIGVKSFRRVGMGIFGATNCALRKGLWEEHHFDENFEMGGEDGEWAKWAINNGYKIIRDPEFVVRHSHNLGPIRYLKQLILWSKLRKPMKFDRSKLINRFDD